MRNAYQVYEVCKELDKQDEKRARKRSRVYKAYNRFPPSEYSLLFKREQDWQSNVPFGMLSYMVDNNHSSFIDMITERPLAADIRVKIGTPKERMEWGDHISVGFDRMLQEWDDYLINCEQDVLDMLLYGKGLEMWEDKEGFTTEHVSADDILVPNGTKISLSNFDILAIKRTYGLHELWEKVEKADGEGRGWRKDAVLTAMWYQRKGWKDKYKTINEWTKAVAEGDVTIGAHLKETLDTYILFCKEFKSGKVSKFIVLRDYAPFLVNENQNRSPSAPSNSPATEPDIGTKIKEAGFLFSHLDYEESIRDIFAVFMDSAGTGMWHRQPSLAEKVFVQCRQYDFTMNAIMDAVKLNMSLMLQASTAEASEKIKTLVFGPYTIIPSDVPFVQQRLQLDTTNATNAVQFMMLDMFRGVGEYRVHEKTQSGQAPTATQSQIDASEAAKLTGTQLKRFNSQKTLYYRRLYKKMVSLVHGEKDYELFQKFKDYMRDCGVPDKAWKWENIDSIKSNMLAGAGSPSFKIMAAEKTIGFTNISPKDEGQANAIEDGIAALHGRANVKRYFNRVKPDKTFNQRSAGWEDSLLSNPFANPADIQVNPDDEDVYHLEVHFSDMARTINLVNEKLKSGQITEFYGEAAGLKLYNQMGHCMAHIEKLKRDPGKQEMLKMATKQLGTIEKEMQMLAKAMQQAKDQKKQDFDPANDPDIQKKIALGQLEVQTQTQLANIKSGALAASHQQKLQNDQEAAANKIAIDRQTAASKVKTESQVERRKATKKPDGPSNT
jgi:hypothetical protein